MRRYSVRIGGSLLSSLSTCQQVMFETFNVPVTFVTIQAVSVHFEDTRRPSCWTLATLCRTQLLSTRLKFLTERGYFFSEREIVRDVKEKLR